MVTRCRNAGRLGKCFLSPQVWIILNYGLGQAYWWPPDCHSLFSDVQYHRTRRLGGYVTRRNNHVKNAVSQVGGATYVSQLGGATYVWLARNFFCTVFLDISGDFLRTSYAVGTWVLTVESTVQLHVWKLEYMFEVSLIYMILFTMFTTRLPAVYAFVITRCQCWTVCLWVLNLIICLHVSGDGLQTCLHDLFTCLISRGGGWGLRFRTMLLKAYQVRSSASRPMVAWGPPVWTHLLTDRFTWWERYLHVFTWFVHLLYMISLLIYMICLLVYMICLLVCMVFLGGGGTLTRSVNKSIHLFILTSSLRLRSHTERFWTSQRQVDDTFESYYLFSIRGRNLSVWTGPHVKPEADVVELALTCAK